MAHDRFPHEPTTDQFFSESQFESYRALGFEIADELLGTALKGRAPSIGWSLDEIAEALKNTITELASKIPAARVHQVRTEVV